SDGDVVTLLDEVTSMLAGPLPVSWTVIWIDFGGPRIVAVSVHVGRVVSGGGVVVAGHVWVRLNTCASPPLGVPVRLFDTATASSTVAPAGVGAAKNLLFE